MIVEEIQIKERYKSIRQKTEDICAQLSIEDHVVQPVEEVSPPKWHLGHTTWFFETMILKVFQKNYELFHEDYGYLFNSYYESAGERIIRSDRGNITRPGVEEVMAYRRYVDEAMAQLLDEENNEEVKHLLELGLQHEQQHQELLIYDIKYILGHNPLFPAYKKLEKHKKNTGGAKELITIEGGQYEIGFQGDGFCFDNEKGRHSVYLHDFGIMNRLVTNEEYLEFMEDNGYEDFHHWLSEGWEWVNANNVKSPHYWHKKDGKWHYFSLNGGLKPVDLAAPVTHISFFEADAYAKWKGMRLPTEEEWEVASGQLGALTATSNFMEEEFFEPVTSVQGDSQFYGDVWEWTGSAYRPYPYYQAPEGAIGEYNGKFMVNQMVLRGGSCATPRDHIRSTYRNFFHPHLRWMLSGMRLAQYV
ncbi:MAG: ergothioneine biosynthesis protein EgtB [Fulvivirga sp.]|nr:ergothioneine biosynthesis protein EgtB [Fulvivirga sp.]